MESSQKLEGELDVQWIANVVRDDGIPTPAAGDSLKNTIWIDVEDRDFGDAEEPLEEDGDPVD